MAMILDGSNGVTFNDASLQGAAASPFGLKNRIINGDMVISQRGTSFSSSGYTLDRWFSGTDTAGAWTITQSSVAPTGFVNSLLYTKTTGNAPVSTAYNYIVQFIEGFNVADLAWGTANARTVTLSFWVRSGATGTFGGTLRNAGDRSYPFTYTISSANTWEQKSVTIPGDTTGNWGVTTAIGISVFFDIGSGTSARATAGAWTAGNFVGASGTSTYPTSTSGGVLFITGVQLERNTTATPFEWIPYTTELQLCQRYFQTISNGAGGSTQSATSAVFGFQFPVVMRVAPAGAVTAPIRISDISTSAFTQSSGNITGNLVTADGGSWTLGNFTSMTVNRPIILAQSSSGTIQLSAEL